MRAKRIRAKSRKNSKARRAMRPLIERPIQTDSVQDDLRLVDELEAASILGWSQSTLQKDRIQQRRVPYVKLGRRVRYRLLDLRQLIEAHIQGGTHKTETVAPTAQRHLSNSTPIGQQAAFP